MDILKNICLNFKFFYKILNFKIILISLIIKIFLLTFLNKKKLKIIKNYFYCFIKKTLDIKNRKEILFFSILFFNIILIYNMIDLLPTTFLKNFFNFKELDLVPTSNINITFSLSIISFFLVNFISIKKISFKNFFFYFFNHPIKNKYMFIFNFLIEFTSFIMKPISLSLRLFGNIFSSEIIFNLISNTNLLQNIILNLLWGFFHYLILPLQSFIFITLNIIYLSQQTKK